MQAQFRHAGARPFDLVIGADGLHSNVRKLVFGAQQEFEKDLGYVVAAFETRGLSPARRGRLRPPQRARARWSGASPCMTTGRFSCSSSPHEESSPTPPDLEAQKAILRRRFGGSGWECAQILETLDRSAGPLFRPRAPDQNGALVKRPGRARRRRRVLRLAAAGQGSALAMTAAYVLAGELGRAGASTMRPSIATRRCCAHLSSSSRKAQSVFPPPLRRAPGGAVRCAIRW